MKKLLTFAISCTCASTLSAATYTISNNQGFDSNQILDSSETLLLETTGSVAFGTFSSDLAVTGATSAATLLDADWTEFGSSETLFDPSSVINGDGFFESQGTSFDTAFNNTSIYLVAGNATSLNSATEFFVYKFGTNFTNVENVFNATLTLGLDSGSILQGNVGPSIIGGGFDGTPEPTFQTASFSAVPEPSSTALLGLGSVALLLRRRR